MLQVATVREGNGHGAPFLTFIAGNTCSVSNSGATGAHRTFLIAYIPSRHRVTF